jgi:hypothetical protein
VRRHPIIYWLVNHGFHCFNHAMTRPGRCWYCGRDNLEDDDDPEHVLPKALGGSLVTRRICQECNERAGREVDRPFLEDWWVGWQRRVWDIRDRRRRDKPAPMPGQRIELEGGVAGKMDLLRERLSVRPLRNDVPDPGAGKDGRQFSVQVEMSRLVWPRMAAKVALATASLRWEDDWLDTPDALRLRDWLWHADVFKLGEPTALPEFPAVRPDAVAPLCVPPQHLLLFMALTDDVCAVVLVVCGMLAIPVDLARAGQPSPDDAWLMDPYVGPPLNMTVEQLSTAADERMNEP